MKKSMMILCSVLMVIGIVGIASISSATFVWTKYGNNPVLDTGAAGEWDSFAVTSPSVIKDGDTYKMWYEGVDAQKTMRIGYATSSDGINWSKYNDMVLDVDGNDLIVGRPSIVKDGDSYKMWYHVRTTDVARGIGYAYSSDGINWTKYGDPVLDWTTSDNWENIIGVSTPDVIKDGDTYKMWYAGHVDQAWRIGYATSSDGISWSKYGSPVLDLSGWATQLVDPSVTIIKNEDTYLMWYEGNTGNDTHRIGYATSSDGINWSNYSDPVLDNGLVGDWDSHSVGAPSVIMDGDDYKMWFGGSATYTERRIGYATGQHSIPEPATMLLIGFGIIGLAGFRRKVRKD